MRGKRAILVGLLVSAVGCVSPAATSPSPTIAGERPAAPTESASPSPVLDDRFGFVTADSSGLRPVVRRESDPRPLFTLAETFAPTAVAPSGRRVAYWMDNKLQILDVAPNAQPRTVFDLSAQPANEQYGASPGRATALGSWS